MNEAEKAEKPKEMLDNGSVGKRERKVKDVHNP